MSGNYQEINHTNHSLRAIFKSDDHDFDYYLEHLGDLMISACGGSCAQRGRPGSWAASAPWLGLGGGIALPQLCP